jgi:hypothetical protein
MSHAKLQVCQLAVIAKLGQISRFGSDEVKWPKFLAESSLIAMLLA